MKKDYSEKINILQFGESLAAMFEADHSTTHDENIMKFLRIHVKCRDWYDHPEWPAYKEIVTQLKDYLDERNSK